ncbi:MAG TPA: hypothetical protein VM802_07815 [Chitinophaga sp.]|uniref:hypothetical protein n=1 Tax=Chitinophaga sp. TaxID=1869181 RepID=UPI002BF652E0|nr:hypothetical protein [Chitinophaga sp.]HVI44760.1 hypothetical protein [Chitinophaga sp.]
MPELKCITTDKNSGFPEFLDFATLRKLGIQHIAEFSGKIWTDHNLHDPGITMLEALCYVLTDLDYRTSFGFSDLVAAPPGARRDDNFFTAAQMLGNNPLTVTDIRKMLIDIKGVRNAWLEKPEKGEFTLSYDCKTSTLMNTPPDGKFTPVPLHGLQYVLIEPDDVYASAYEKDACGNSVFPVEKMLADINERLHTHRNLCEDFAGVIMLEKQPVSLCLHIELAANYDPEDVLVNIYSNIQDFFSPAPRFYTMQQLLDKGRSMEEIFEGRPYNFDLNETLLVNGFIDTMELESLERRTDIHASDLYRIIMSVPGVAGITRLVMSSEDPDAFPVTDASGEKVTPEGEEWCLRLRKNHRPVLSPETSNVIFFRNKIPFTADISRVKQRYLKIISDYNKFPKSETSLDTVVPPGRQMELAQYTSVQYEFPQNYLIGKHEVSLNDTAARKAQTLQLRAYLLFYDRLLADYLSQLSHIRQLFALQPGGEDAQHTYFPADLNGIPQLPSLLRYARSLPGTSQNNTPKGTSLAFEPAQNGLAHRQYDSMFLRDESIRRIINACAGNDFKAPPRQSENGDWYFVITDLADNLLLISTGRFSKKEDAEQAARDVGFLAGLPGSYNRINNRKDDQYSFDVVYNDAGYTEMLTAIYETGTQYQERKERFLNHLLARFSEDFTDYALMMYNLSGKKNDPDRNIADKTAFLAAYPETSANRALAFNYIQPPAGFPVSGLQRRVDGLMGIRKSPGVSLSNFDLVVAETLERFTYKTALGEQPLFISESLHQKEDETNLNTNFIPLAAKRSNYKPYGCPGEGVYGFTVQSPVTDSQQMIARCTVECTTAAERDNLADWLAGYFAQHGGLYQRYTRTKEGYYFLLQDENEIILLKGTEAHTSPDEALIAGYNCLEVLQEDSVWQVVQEQISGNYIILIKEDNILLARHPQVFGSNSAATQKMTELQRYFRRHNLVYHRDTDELYNWQLNHHHKPAWQGAAAFRSDSQLPVAFEQFVVLAAQTVNYLIVQETGGYILQVTRTETVNEDTTPVVTVIAHYLSAFRTREEAEQARDRYVSLFNRIWGDVSNMVTEMDAAIYHFQDLEAPEGMPLTLLYAVRPVPEGPTAAHYTRNVIRSAADPALLTISPATGCRYWVQLHDACGHLLAVSPEADDQAAAEKIKERILLLAGENSLWCERGKILKAYGFLLKDAGDPLLQSIPVWDTREEVFTALLAWIMQAAPRDIQPEQQPGNGFGYMVFAVDKSPFARQAQWYPSAEKRDAALNVLQQQLDRMAGNTDWVQLSLYHYYFKIQEPGGMVLLEGTDFYTTDEDARIAFYETVRLGRKRKYYMPVTYDNCTYSFTLLDDEQQVIAVHPVEYTTTAARDAAIERTIRFLLEYGQPVTAINLAGSWSYSLEWLSCCGRRPETALLGLDEKMSEEEAKDALKAILDLIRNDEKNLTVLQDDNGYRVFVVNGDLRLAVHPHWFGCGLRAKETRDRIYRWILNASTELSFTPETVNTVLYQQKDNVRALIGYRLWDREYRIARYVSHFDTPVKRNEVMQQLRNRYQRKLPVYTVLEKGDTVVVSENGLFYFQLRRNNLLLWQSVNAYPDTASAAAAFSGISWYILQLAAKTDNYSKWTGNNKELFLYDTKGQPLAIYKEAFSDEEAFDAAIRTRRLFALQHGVYRQSGGTYGFHIYDIKTDTYEWESIPTYPDPDQAFAALSEFLQLLRYRGNYCPDNETVGCYYSINIGKVLLDIKEVTKRCGDEDPKVDESGAWNRLQSFLDNRSESTGSFFRYTDYTAGCRYAFRMVDDAYRVAQHTGWFPDAEHRKKGEQDTGWFQDMEKREKRRTSLVADINCRRELYGHFVNPRDNNITAPEDPAKNNDETDKAYILGCYFKHPEKLNAQDLWLSYNDIQDMFRKNSKDEKADIVLWKIVEETLAGNVTLYHYQMTGVNGEVVWNAVTRYTSKELAQNDKERFFFVFLMEMARTAASYYYEPLADCDKAFRLSLRDMDGRTIAVAPDIICAPDIERDRATRIFNAMAFPVVENTDGYTFEINNIAQVEEEGETIYQYNTVWESSTVYDTPEDAMAALKEAVGLLGNIDNYQRDDENSCGPFGIVLVNPSHILAGHPLTYISVTAREIAIRQVQEAISSEGFHLLEHLLLRPRTQQQLHETLQLEVRWTPAGKDGDALELKIRSESAFGDVKNTGEAAFLKALQEAAARKGIYIEEKPEQFIISWWRNDERVASAALAKTPAASDALADLDTFRAGMQSTLANTVAAAIVTVTLPVNCDAGNDVLPVCDDVCLCDNHPQATDLENDPCDCTFLADPYSFWATVVLPAWPQRFRLARFRQFFEDTLRREAPSHIRLNIVWVGPQQMLQFEKAWKQWITALSREDSCDYNDSLRKLNDILMKLRNVYPAAFLYDDQGGDNKPLVLLDEAILGL